MNRGDRNVLVTGASGFVGANLCRNLIEKNYKVHIIQRKVSNNSWRLESIKENLVIHKGDITNYNSLRKAVIKSEPDYIIHLATYGAYHSQSSLTKAIEVNIRGIKNLLEATKDTSYKCFINTGTSSEYGYKSKAMTEDDSCFPVSYYAATKLCATNICKAYSDLNNKPIVTLRLFSVYGPYEEPGRFIPTITSALHKKEAVKLTAGNFRRDFVYIDDVVSAYLKCMQKKDKVKGEIINIGTGAENSNAEVVKKLFKVAGIKTVVEKNAYPNRPWDTPHWKADIRKAKKVISWEPKHDIENGLNKTFNWMNNYIKQY